MAFFRRKQGSLYYVWINDAGKERSKVIGPDTMPEKQALVEVGRLGLDKLASLPDPLKIAFGRLAAKYLNEYPFNKTSTRELHEQIVNAVLLPKWEKAVATEIDPRKLKAWFLELEVQSPTRGKYRSIMSSMLSWGQCEGLIPRGEEFNPLNYVKGREFSAQSGYEALALEPEDVLKILAELQQQPEYELGLLIATTGLRISEALGLRWQDIGWNRGRIKIAQTFVHFQIQDGAKTKLSAGRVEAPKLLLDALETWRKQTMYAADDDFVFPSVKLGGRQPRSASMLVEDYLRPAAIRAGVLKVKDGITYGPDGDQVKRFGFHNFRHSLATFLMDEGENPAVTQAIMRHAKLDMTLYYSHSQRKQKRAALDKVVERFLPGRELQRELTTNSVQ